MGKYEKAHLIMSTANHRTYILDLIYQASEELIVELEALNVTGTVKWLDHDTVLSFNINNSILSVTIKDVIKGIEFTDDVKEDYNKVWHGLADAVNESLKL